MAVILDGKALSKTIKEKLKTQASKLIEVPKLAIIQVGELAESNTYIKHKKNFASDIGVEVLHLKFEEEVPQSDLIKEIRKLNEDKSIGGIIVQLPLPKHLNPSLIVEEINENKDVDGQTASNLKKLLNGEPGFIPATTRGIITLLEAYSIPTDVRAVIVGRSTLVGKPTALALLNKNATVTICHSKTKDLENLTKEADLLILAIGKPQFFDKKFVREGQVVIDVGINQIEYKEKNKIVGDVDFEAVKELVRAITPVPGGVGPMTICSLFQNLLEGSY